MIQSKNSKQEAEEEREYRYDGRRSNYTFDPVKALTAGLTYIDLEEIEKSRPRPIEIGDLVEYVQSGKISMEDEILKNTGPFKVLGVKKGKSGKFEFLLQSISDPKIKVKRKGLFFKKVNQNEDNRTKT